MCTNLDEKPPQITKINHSRWEIEGGMFQNHENGLQIKTCHIPTYARTELTDSLHGAFGFRTDYGYSKSKTNEKNYSRYEEIKKGTQSFRSAKIPEP